MERNMHRLEQYSRRECIKIARIPSSITNGLLEEQVILISNNLEVVLEAMAIVTCRQLGKTSRAVVKLINRKD